MLSLSLPSNILTLPFVDYKLLPLQMENKPKIVDGWLGFISPLLVNN